MFTTSWLEGQILVNNRSFAKDNGVRLSEPTTATRSMTLTASSRARTPTTASSLVLARRSGSSRRRN